MLIDPKLIPANTWGRRSQDGGTALPNRADELLANIIAELEAEDACKGNLVSEGAQLQDGDVSDEEGHGTPQ